jgi:hypothetical protein
MRKRQKREPTRDNPPIIVPRFLLTAKYLLLAVLGLSVFIATSPSLNLTGGDYLSPIWGALMVIASLVAAVGSVSIETEALERWSSSAVVILLIVYAFSPVAIILTTGDADRLAYSVTALALTGVPSARAWYLLRRTGLKMSSEVK